MKMVRRAFAIGAAVLVLAACNPRFEDGASLQVTAASGGILLQWPAAVEYDEGQTIAQYRIDVDGAEVARLGGTARSCQLTKVAAGTHTVQVTAYDSNGDWSGTVVPAGTLSATVSGPTLDASDATPGCVASGATDPTAIAAAWTTINATLPAHGSTANTSNCTPGTTTQAYRTAALDKVNAYRALSGVGPTTESATYTAQAQNTALLMAANGQISHNPPSTWACYTADGATGASTSNLGYTGTSSPPTTTTDGIKQYVVDGSGYDLHRRWVLCPGTTQMGFGKAVGFVSPWYFQMDTLKVIPSTSFPAGQSRDGFIAWPNPGVVPVNLATGGLLDVFTFMAPNGRSVTDAVVTISSSNGIPVTADSVTKSNGYCGPGMYYFPSRAPQAGETWTFTVSGLKNADNSSYTAMWTTTFQTM
ncbi:MAG: CAP domain-containing protein [Actinobacteria bacterium]|nr:CAP domain-containing protein [Actinomycetota bacterium]